MNKNGDQQDKGLIVAKTNSKDELNKQNDIP